MRDLATVSIRVLVRFSSEMCKLRMCDFKMAQHILQIAQIDKLRATHNNADHL